MERESWIDPALSVNTSKGTVASHTFTYRSNATTAATSDHFSEITPPTSINHIEEMMEHHVLDDLPKQPIRVKVDPSTVSRWRPKHTQGAHSPGSKTALLVALQEQNHKMVEHMLDGGVPPNGGSECNLLRVAISNHDLDNVRLLLLFGADPNAKDKERFTPLYAATEALFYDAAHLLLKYGGDPNMCACPNQESPFTMSLNHGKAHFAQLYLKYNADPNAIMECGETPFSHAMNKVTPIQLVELLLVYEADPKNKNSHGEIPLFKAINSDRLDLVTVLLDHGANPNLPGPKHMLWPSAHRPQILQQLLKKGADLRRALGVLELATSINSVEAVQILLKHGANPNAKKDGIFTPLCTAIRDNRENLVDIIIAAGADPNLPASEYPAFKCVTHHRAHLLPRVLAAGADPNSPKGIIETAVASNNQDALVYLLKQKVDPNAHDAAGHTALTTAIRKKDLGFIDILLAHCADPGVRGHEWPVSMAVKNPDVLAKLLPHLPTAKIPKGALEMAVQADQLNSVKLLLAKGVEVEEKNGGVFSPLTTSIREDRKAIFQLFLEEAGADPTRPGEHLPIVKAIRRHREDDLSYIKHLLAREADINLMYRGWNAVLQALDKGDTQTLRLLAELGTPDLNARDEDGNTVLEIMQQRGMREEEQILLGGRSGSPPKGMKEANRQLKSFVKQ
jgi:ankyrin repeat protein